MEASLDMSETSTSLWKPCSKLKKVATVTFKKTWMFWTKANRQENDDDDHDDSEHGDVGVSLFAMRPPNGSCDESERERHTSLAS